MVSLPAMLASIKSLEIFFICIVFTLSLPAQSKVNFNRAPLKQNPYYPLPIGAIRPEGWLRDQLLRQKSGMTGNLDNIFGNVVGESNGWLGGEGDCWERGPYWLDGLLPLAYILKDKELIAKCKPWVEWTLTHQRKDGYIGPEPLPEGTKEVPGLQRTPSEDWWPRMVMLKVLQQYYGATNDKRVITCFQKYFQYQLKTLPEKPLDSWSFWANQRGADNLQAVYWLYNITGDSFLLELADIIYKQTYPFTTIFLNLFRHIDGSAHLFPANIPNTYPFNQELISKLHIGQVQSFHCVNLVQGIKTPGIYYQQHTDSIYLKATKTAFRDLIAYHGQAQGMFGGDEPLHGAQPTQGAEFCSIVEFMYSLEHLVGITGDMEYADHLEKIAFNALPTQATDEFDGRQYFQAANQILCTREHRNFCEEDYHDSTDLCFGPFTGYTCCTANMHQGWPKYVQNLWYASSDGGVAALLYGASQLTTTLPDGTPVKITEETNYPFEESVRFKFSLAEEKRFPLHLRIPAWAKGAQILLNGELMDGKIDPGTEYNLNWTWKNGDVVELKLPMEVRSSSWVDNSVAIERGPLVYALKIEEEWKEVKSNDRFVHYKEVYPKSDWNFGLTAEAIKDVVKSVEVIPNPMAKGYPWNLQNAPISLKINGKRLPNWKIYNHQAGPMPQSYMEYLPYEKEQKLTLIPYGCTTLRITQFPVVH